MKFLGIEAGYEEQRETQEETGAVFKPACGQCLDLIPDGSAKYPTGLKKHFKDKPQCINREFWNILGPKYVNE